MPTYVYECSKCGDELEVWQSFSEDPLKKHAGCGGKLTKVLQPVGIVLKGPGFYKTDSRNGKKPASGGEKSSDSSTTSEKKGEAKPEPKKAEPTKAASSSTSSGSPAKSG